MKTLKDMVAGDTVVVLRAGQADKKRTVVKVGRKLIHVNLFEDGHPSQRVNTYSLETGLVNNGLYSHRVATEDEFRALMQRKQDMSALERIGLIVDHRHERLSNWELHQLSKLASDLLTLRRNADGS